MRPESTRAAPARSVLEACEFVISEWPAVGVLTVLAALVRFPTLGVQRFWVDEAVTVGLLHLDLGQLLDAIPASESTPPLYYVIAWCWSKLFGTGEFGLRALSAMAGTLTVPVIYAAARQFAATRAALLAAALTCVSPLLVWYSQEARAYALLVLLSALTLLCFGRALRRPGRGTLTAWSVACALAVATHYFAGFLVLAEAIWLLLKSRSPRGVAVACVPVVLATAALAPLAIHQRSQGHLAFIAQRGLTVRVAESAKMFVSGPTGILVAHASAVGLVLLTLALAAFALRSRRDERRRAVPVLAVLVGGLVPPVVLALAGYDYILARNLLPLWLPLAIVAGIGLTATPPPWMGTGLAIALCSFSAALSVAVPLTPKLRRQAANAALVHLPGGNVAVDIRYVPVPAGERRSGSVRCPGGYRASLVRAHWMDKAESLAGLATARSNRGGNATVTQAPSDSLDYVVTVVCVPVGAGERSAGPA